MTSLMLVFRLPVLRSLNAGETARLLVYTGHQLRRARSGGQSRSSIFKPKNKSKAGLKLLQQLPGIGPHRALCLMEHFGSVKACLTANESDLTKVPGLGKKSARAIVASVSEPQTTYGKHQSSHSWNRALLASGFR